MKYSFKVMDTLGYSYQGVLDFSNPRSGIDPYTLEDAKTYLKTRSWVEVDFVSNLGTVTTRKNLNMNHVISFEIESST